MKKIKITLVLLIGFLMMGQPAEAQLINSIFKAGAELYKIQKKYKKDKKKSSKDKEEIQNEENIENSKSETKEVISGTDDKNTPNKKDEVTLTVSADGLTKEDATKSALRSAIEQAYGTFVSANTTILNDELVKDEIVTVSSGNIKQYSEIASNLMPNGKYFVTLNATVSISRLTSYAQSKGATTEFAGATFAMNMKMKELNKKNEEIAIKNLIKQVLEMYPSVFTFKIDIGDPHIPTYFDYSDDIKQNYYEVEVKIYNVCNEQMVNMLELIKKTFMSLALTYEEIEEYRNLNLDYYKYQLLYDERLRNNYRKSNFFELVYELYRKPISLRSTAFEELAEILFKKAYSFQVVDNLGKVSQIKKMGLYNNEVFGTNHFSNGRFQSVRSCSVKSLGFFGNLYYYFLLPKKDIDKYTYFRVEPVPVESIEFE